MKSIVILCLLGDPMVPPTSEPSRAGGYNIDVKQWLEHLSGLSLEIIVITNLSPHFPTVIEAISSSITIYRVGIREDSFKNGHALMDQYASVRKNIVGILDSKKVEPIFFHSYYWYNGLFAKDLSSKYGVPFVHTIIDMAAYKMISGDTVSFAEQYDIEKEIFSKATYLFAMTSAEKDVLLKYYHMRAEKVIVTGRQADEVFLHPDHDSYGQAGEGTVSKSELEGRFLGSKHEVLNKWWSIGAFMYYGRLVEMKGIRYIIKAWHNLYKCYDGDIPPLWIVGGTPSTIAAFRNTLERDIPISKLESNQQLCWWGSLSQRSIRTLMMKSCAVIMHSQHESGCLVVLEALAAGIPIIATDTGFAKDIIEDWHAGFKVDYTDTDSLAGRMNLFIRQPLMSRCMGISASELYRYIQKNWHSFGKMDNIYESLCERRYNKRFKDIVAYTGRNCLKQRRLNEIPTLDMQKDWIIQTFNTSQNCNNSIENMLPMKSKSSASDIWEVRTKGKTYIAKRMYSILNTSRFLFQDEPPGFHSIDRFRDSLISTRSRNVLQPLSYAENYYMIILPAVKIADCISIDLLYDAVSLLKLFHEDMPSFPTDEICQKPALSQNRILNVLCDGTSCFDRGFQDSYSRKIYSLRVNASSEESHNGIIYGKTAIGHLVYMDNRSYLLPSADIRFGDTSMDYAFTIIDYIIHKNNIDKEETYHIIETCSDLTDISSRTLCISIALVIALRLKMQYMLHSFKPNTQMDELLEIVLSML